MSNEQIVYIVDDDEDVREGFGLLMDTVGQPYRTFDSALAFLEAYDPAMDGCLVLDIRMPRMTGLELQERLNEMGSLLPIIFMTGHGDIPMAVDAMRRGALDFIRKPFREQDLLERINEALDLESGRRKRELDLQRLNDRVASLTEREQEVFKRVADGEMNKVADRTRTAAPIRLILLRLPEPALRATPIQLWGGRIVFSAIPGSCCRPASTY
jgi:FixJ family two-component response regulator